MFRTYILYNFALFSLIYSSISDQHTLTCLSPSCDTPITNAYPIKDFVSIQGNQLRYNNLYVVLGIGQRFLKILFNDKIDFVDISMTKTEDYRDKIDSLKRYEDEQFTKFMENNLKAREPTLNSSVESKLESDRSIDNKELMVDRAVGSERKTELEERESQETTLGKNQENTLGEEKDRKETRAQEKALKETQKKALKEENERKEKEAQEKALKEAQEKALKEENERKEKEAQEKALKAENERKEKEVQEKALKEENERKEKEAQEKALKAENERKEKEAQENALKEENERKEKEAQDKALIEENKRKEKEAQEKAQTVTHEIKKDQSLEEIPRTSKFGNRKASFSRIETKSSPNTINQPSEYDLKVHDMPQVSNKTELTETITLCLNQMINQYLTNRHVKIPILFRLFMSWFIFNHNFLNVLFKSLPSGMIGLSDNFSTALFGMDSINVASWSLIIIQVYLIYLVCIKLIQLIIGPFNLETSNVSKSDFYSLKENLSIAQRKLLKVEFENANLLSYSNDLLAECSELRVKETDNSSTSTKFLTTLKAKLESKTEELSELQKTHDAIATELLETRETNKTQMESLESEWSEKFNLVSKELDETKKRWDLRSEEFEVSLNKQKEENNTLYKQAHEYYEQMKKMQTELNDQAEEILRLEKSLSLKDSEISSLLTTLSDLKALENEASQFNQEEEAIMEEQEISEEVEVTDDETDPDDASSLNTDSGEGWDTDLISCSSPSMKPKKTKIIRQKKTILVPVKKESTDLEPTMSHEAKLNKILDLAKFRSEIERLTSLSDELDRKYKYELDLRMEIEKNLRTAETEIRTMNEVNSKSIEEKNRAIQKLEILSDYFEKREIDITNSLNRKNIVSDDELKNYKDKIKMNEADLAILKDQNNSLKSQLMDLEKSNRKLRIDFDKINHDSWIESRHAINQIKELREENSALRQRLTQTSTKRKIVTGNQNTSSRLSTGSGNSFTIPCPISLRNFKPPPPPPPPPISLSGPFLNDLQNNRSSSRQSMRGPMGESKTLDMINQNVNRIPPPPFPFIQPGNFDSMNYQKNNPEHTNNSTPNYM